MSIQETDPTTRHEIQPGSATHIVATMGIPTGLATAFLVNENVKTETGQSAENESLINDQSFAIQTFGSPDLLVASVGVGLVACTGIAVAIERCKRRGESFTGLRRRSV